MLNKLEMLVLPSLRSLETLLGSILFAAFSVGGANAASFTPFAPTGAGGALNGQNVQIGSGGSVFEIDAFVSSAAAGPTALSGSPTPASLGGLDITFGASLALDGTDVLLTYSIQNTGAGSVGDIRFISYLDAEIDEPLNTFFNEYATTRGTLDAGQNFEVDEPGFRNPPGDIFANASGGALDGTNALDAPTNTDDVAMGLQFEIGSLDAGELATIEILISEDADFLGSFAIDQRDADPRSQTVISYSGRVLREGPGPQIPEPSSALLLAIGTGVVGRHVRRR